MTSIRSSLARIVPSDEPPELASYRSEQAQRTAFTRHGLVVVPTRGKVDGLPRLVQVAVEAWAKARFGEGQR